MVGMVRMVRMGTFRHFWLSTVQMVCLVNMRVSSILDGLVSKRDRGQGEPPTSWSLASLVTTPASPESPSTPSADRAFALEEEEEGE